MNAGGKSSSSSSLSSTRAPSKQQDVLDSFSAMHQSSSASFTPASLANTTRNQARETTPGGRRPMYVNTDVRKTNSRLQNLSLSSSSTRTRRVMGHSASASLLSCAPSSQRRAQRTGSTHPSHSGGSSSCQTTFTGLETRSSVSSAAAASLLARRQQKQSFDSFAKNRNAKLPVQTSHRVRLDLRTRSNPTSSAPSPSSLTSSSTPSRSALSSHHFDSSLSSTSTNDSPSSFTSKSMPPPSPIDRKSKGVHTHKHRRKKSYNTNNYSYSHNHSHNHNTSRNHIPATTQMNGHLSRIVPLVHPSTPYLFPVDTTMQMPQALPARPSSSRGRPQTHAGVSGGRSGPYLCNSGSLTSRVYSSSNGGSKTETNTIGNSDKESNSKVTNILSLEE